MDSDLLSHCQKLTLQQLDALLKKENHLWISGAYDSSNNNLQHGISSVDRRVVVWWMMRTSRLLRFSRETMFLAVAIFDKFLRLVKVQQKYLKCIALTCLYLAAKVIEEDDVIPSTRELIRSAGCAYSPREVCRMELCILDNLQWNVNLVTSIDVLHLLYSLFLSHCKADRVFENQQHIHYLYIMTKLLKVSLLHHQLLVYPPSVLALSVLTLQLSVVWPYWKAARDELISLMMMDEKQVNDCCQTVISLMSDILHSSVKSTRRPRCARKLLKRKSEDDEDLTEGIKKLYTEDDDYDKAGGGKTGFQFTSGNVLLLSNPSSTASSSFSGFVAAKVKCGCEVSWLDPRHFSMKSGKAT